MRKQVTWRASEASESGDLSLWPRSRSFLFGPPGFLERLQNASLPVCVVPFLPCHVLYSFTFFFPFPSSVLSALCHLRHRVFLRCLRRENISARLLLFRCRFCSTTGRLPMDQTDRIATILRPGLPGETGATRALRGIGFFHATGGAYPRKATSVSDWLGT